MSRITRLCWVICCALLLGWAGTSMAGDRGSTNGEVGAIADATGRARDTPPQNFVLPIPGASDNGSDYRLDCSIGAFRNSDNFDPRKGVRGRITADIQVCDIARAPISCAGVFRVFRRRFKTDAGGFALTGIVITAEQLPSLDGHPPSAHANVIVTSRFTNRKKVAAYNLGCHIAPMPPE